MFKVVFETPEIIFREVRTEYNLDLDLLAKFSGYSEVENYDKNIFSDEVEVERKLKKECSQIIKMCLNDNWNQELSVCLKWNDYLNDMFDDALSKLGITAKTTICSMPLNEEDAKAINDWLDSVSHPGRSTGCPPVDLSEKALKEWVNKGMDLLHDQGR